MYLLAPCVVPLVTADQLLAYFRSFVKRHGLEPYIRYNTEVAAARYDEKQAVWDVELKSNSGA